MNDLKLSDSELAGHVAYINSSLIGEDRKILIKHGVDWKGFTKALKRLKKAGVKFNYLSFPARLDLSDPEKAESAKPILDEIYEYIEKLREVGPTAFEGPDKIEQWIISTVPNATPYFEGLEDRDPEKVFIIQLSDFQFDRDELEHISKMVNARIIQMFNAEIEYSALHLIDFGALKDLQFLDLSMNPLESLPEEFEKLSSLESLKLYKCQQLWEIDADLTKLSNLRLLDLRKTDVDADTVEELREKMPDCTIRTWAETVRALAAPDGWPDVSRARPLRRYAAPPLGQTTAGGEGKGGILGGVRVVTVIGAVDILSSLWLR